jgi:hypothetical protein
LNLYGYVFTDPVNLIDLNGLAPSWVGPTGVVVTAIGGTVTTLGIATGNGPAIAIGIGLAVIGSGLTLWDWATTPAETLDMAKDRIEDFQKTVDKFNDRLEDLDNCR